MRAPFRLHCLEWLVLSSLALESAKFLDGCIVLRGVFQNVQVASRAAVASLNVWAMMVSQ